MYLETCPQFSCCTIQISYFLSILIFFIITFMYDMSGNKFLQFFFTTAFHLNSKLPTVIPESCLLIVMGLIVGALLHFTKIANTDEYVLDADVFFIYLLPPIIFDAGYFMPVRSFFDNLGTILLLAFVNTCISAGLIAASLYGISLLGWFGRTISILDCFIFSSLISAVDPVAVLSVFEEVHVNQMLYIIVFGESLLNDGVTVVSILTITNHKKIPYTGKTSLQFCFRLICPYQDCQNENYYKWIENQKHIY